MKTCRTCRLRKDGKCSLPANKGQPIPYRWAALMHLKAREDKEPGDCPLWKVKP